jgi:hypothetical protein
MMTGDWAAAVWYQGIKQGSNQAQWLTDQFMYPTFYPDTPFEVRNYNVYNDPCNPVWSDPCQPTGYYDHSQSWYPYLPDGDSGWSEVNDIVNGGKLQVKIFYEVVDLGEQDANGVGGSPISFRDANETVAYVNSERWIVFCTYSIKNVSDSNIYGLEFYQMLCGLYGIAYYSSYTNENYSDPLASYVPYNSVHQVGNFRYDISQWGYGDPNTQHVDWIGFR